MYRDAHAHTHKGAGSPEDVHDDHQAVILRRVLRIQLVHQSVVGGQALQPTLKINHYQDSACDAHVVFCLEMSNGNSELKIMITIKLMIVLMIVDVIQIMIMITILLVLPLIIVTLFTIE